MKLVDESPHDYLLFCRQAVLFQQQFIQSLLAKQARIPIQEFDSIIDAELEILTKLQERYNRARKGIYE